MAKKLEAGAQGEGAQGAGAQGAGAQGEVEQQAREQVGQRQIQLRIDERNMTTSYGNAFRTNGTAEEVVLDFGFNMMGPAAEGGQPLIVFKVNDRVIMNWYSAKRLAMALGQLVRRHEDQFGQIELDVAKRSKGVS